MVLAHELPLAKYNFHPLIGGSAGKGTHGGTRHVSRPVDMPTKDECTHVVSNKHELLDAIVIDDAIIYIDNDIDVTGVEDHEIGDGITLVGGFCDPAIPGRGPVIHSDEPSKYVFTSSYGRAPTLWGISAKGPEMSYIDPDHTADDFSETFASFLFCYDDDTLRVHGCEFFGWTLAGLLCGAKNHPTTTIVERSSFHHCQMEHLGYGIEHYDGFLSIRQCFFDKCRHAVSSFGYPTGGYAISESVIGPGPWCGHALDMHGLANNINTNSRVAGEFIRVYKCTIMSTWDIGGYEQEGIAIRGIPKKMSYADKCNFWHNHPPDPLNPNVQGEAIRQETDRFRNFEERDNIYGKGNFGDGSYGAPRLLDESEPKPEPKPTMKPLTITGREGHGKIQYRIGLSRGTATSTKKDGSMDVIENPHGTDLITGSVWGGWSDTFELSTDAKLDSIETSGPTDITFNGTPVDQAPLVATAQWYASEGNRDGDENGDTPHDHTEVNERINDLSTEIDGLMERMLNATIDFGLGGKKK